MTAHHVDLLYRLPCARHKRVRKSPLAASQGEHRTVMVGIGVNIQEPSGAARGEGRSNHVDHSLVTALRDIGHRQQRDWVKHTGH